MLPYWANWHKTLFSAILFWWQTAAGFKPLISRSAVNCFTNYATITGQLSQETFFSHFRVVTNSSWIWNLHFSISSKLHYQLCHLNWPIDERNLFSHFLVVPIGGWTQTLDLKISSKLHYQICCHNRQIGTRNFFQEFSCGDKQWLDLNPRSPNQ